MLRNAVKIIAVNLMVLAVLFLFAEGVFRVIGYYFIQKDKAFRFLNYPRHMNASVFEGQAYPAVADPVLGFAPKPGVFVTWSGITVMIGADGVRGNGQPSPARSRPLVLAVGDSFTYGDQVADSETWPADLERRLKTPVINAGVFGYGVGQSYLRAGRLIDSLKPDLLLFGIIPEDIERVGLSARMGAAKPVYDLDGERLKLQPPDQAQALLAGDRYALMRGLLGGLQRLFGYSFLIHEAMMRMYPEAWLSNRFSLRVHDRGVAVSCRLMAEIANLPTAQKAVVAQYPAPYPVAEKAPQDFRTVLDCARRAGLTVIDGFAELRSRFKADKLGFSKLYGGHMTAAGNAFTATLIDDHLRRAGIAKRLGLD